MNSDSHALEWLLFVVTGVLSAAFAWLYFATQADLASTFDAPLEPLSVSVDSASVEEGERLTILLGCVWCHGEGLGGKKYFASADRGLIIVAPNVTEKIRDYSEAEFVRAIRHGVRPDGTSLQVAMPAYSFFNLSDSDLAAVMAYIKTLPGDHGVEGRFSLNPFGWYRWVSGDMTPLVAQVIDHGAARPAPGAGASVERGRYLAESICTECHSDIGRMVVPIAPDLRIAATYTYAEFAELMRTGVPRDGRQLDWNMTDASRFRFELFTEDEVRALHNYFRSLLNLPAEPAA